MAVDMSESSRTREHALNALNRTSPENDAVAQALVYVGDVLREGFVELGKLVASYSDDVISTMRATR